MKSPKRKTLEDIFQEINRNQVRIRKKDRKNYNIILYSVLHKLLEMMKEKDLLFKSMKPKLEYLGSYFDGLRVGQPTEYDINVILKLPIDYNKIVLHSEPDSFDQAIIKMPSEFRRLSKVVTTASKGFDKTSMWCDKDFRLSVTKFRSWMQSILDAALSNLEDHGGKKFLRLGNKYYHILTKMSGPALTLKIQIGSNDKEIIDVDLVPTFSFTLPKKPAGSMIDFDRVESTGINEYFAVPKPSENEYSWRLAFPFQERYYMKDKSYFKSAVKLIKLLRDVQHFQSLASYYIKTLFLWEIHFQSSKDGNRKTVSCFWKNNSLSYLVLHMLKKLRDSLRRGEIKSFWCPKLNLIEKKINEETCRNWSNRLSLIIETMENKAQYNPEIIFPYFKDLNHKC